MNLTKASLARRIGVSWQQMQNYEKGIYRPPDSRLRLISQETGVPLEVLLGLKPSSPPLLPSSSTTPPERQGLLLEHLAELTNRMEQALAKSGWQEVPLQHQARIPVVACVRAGPDGLATEEEGDHIWVPEEWEDCRAVRVRGNSMESFGIHDGDLVIVRLQNDAEDGQVVVVWKPDGCCTVKRLFHRRGKPYVGPDRQHLEPLEEGARILGRALEARKKL